MSTRLLDLRTCICAVIASETVHDAMRHYVSSFLVSTDRQPDITVSLGCDPAAVASARRFFASQPVTTVRVSHPEQRYRVWITEEQEVLLPEHAPDHVITATPDLLVIAAEQSRTAASIGTRVVRQLIIRGGEVQSGQCVHAATVDIDGHGVLIGGHSGAGKTTVLTHLIKEHGARPVSNDRTVLIPIGDKRWQAIGVPLAWRYTPDSIDGSPALAAALTDFEPRRGRHLVDGKIELTPGEISNLFGRPTVPITEIQRIVILTRSSTPPAAKPHMEFLRQHLDFGTEDFFAEDWLNLRSHTRVYGLKSTTSRHAFWSRLAKTLPVRTLTWTDPAELPRVAADAYQRDVRP